MKVFDLTCQNRHRFEGWFQSEADYEAQAKGNLLTCPLCSNTQIDRLPSAARLNLSAHQSGNSANLKMHEAINPARHYSADQTGLNDQTQTPGMQATWLKAIRYILEHSTDVGQQFSEEARKIHYGERQARLIHGTVSPSQALELEEEEIECLTLPLPDITRQKLQ